VRPIIIVCAEPISPGVSIQAQIINLLEDCRTICLTYLFNRYDLSVCATLATVWRLMYLGKLVELTDRDTLYAGLPILHAGPALCGAHPRSKVEDQRKRIILQAMWPSPRNRPAAVVSARAALEDRPVGRKGPDGVI